MSTTAANEAFTISDQATIAFTRHWGPRPVAQFASELPNVARRA